MSRFLFVLVFAATAAQAQAPDTLRSPIPELARYGWSVDATDDWLLVGADERVFTGDAMRANPKGTVFVYRLGEGVPQLAGRLVSDRIGNQDCFSWSMDVRGDLAVIGAYCEVTDGRFGAAYVYRYDGNEWVREAKLRPADAPGNPEYFGGGVAVGDGYIAVGGGGKVLVYELENGVWTVTATLAATGADGQTPEGTGVDFATIDDSSGTYILSGSPNVSGPGGELYRGATHVFERTGATWAQVARLTCPALDRSCGTVLGGDGVRASVASDNAIYPVRREGTVWSLGAALTPAGFSTHGVAQWGDTVLGLGGPRGTDNRLSLLQLAPEASPLFRAYSTDLLIYLPVSVNSTTAFVASENSPGLVLMQRLDGAVSSAELAPELSAPALTLAPNPASTEARIRFETATDGEARLVVADLLGRRMVDQSLGTLSAGAHEIPLDVEHMAAGVYVVRIEVAGAWATRRLVVR